MKNIIAHTWFVAGLISLAVGQDTYAVKINPLTPNIVIIVADDMGWADVGYHGSAIKTPVLDRLCKEGVELDRHYVTPLCTPTRVCLLTGRYASRFGNVAPSNTRVLPWKTATMASVLRDCGYDTAITGKWHLGSLPKWGPRQFGFKQSHGSLAGGVGPYNHLYKGNVYNVTWHRNDKLIKETGHVTDLITKEAVAFIGKKRDTPFFLYVPFTAVHDPFDEPQKYVDMAGDFSKGRQQYAASAMHLDHAVGEIVAAIEATKQTDNTIVLFFSDNGGTRGEGGKAYPGKIAFSSVQGDNTPLRGGKRTVYEGGTRTPAFVVWPGRLKAGTKLASPIHVCDWLPTFAAMTRYQPTRDLKWDGKDIMSLLRDKVQPVEPRTLYCKGINSMSSVHYGKWKLVYNGKSKAVELFQIVSDPNEKKDVSKQHPDRVAELLVLLKAEQAKDNDALPDRKLD